MKSFEITRLIENWAPLECAWEKDNTGLQVGSLQKEVTNVFICLELTETALEEAVKQNCNLIITHHPLIFNPLKKIDIQNDLKAKIIENLIKQDINLYSAHTNLDFTNEGVSYALAKALNLTKIEFLKNQNANQYKVVVFVPENNIEKLSNTVFAAGAGVIGDYKKCSYRINGYGTFEGSENTKPAVGSALKFEVVPEIRLEFIVDSWNLKKVISALLSNHPYEEPAYDIYPLSNINTNYGEGALGYLPEAMDVIPFLNYIAQHLNVNNFRYCNGQKSKIEKVAVCGGSGSDLIKTAISKQADAFITADVKYHTFQESEDRILLVDAGHYETEIFSLFEIQKRIQSLFDKNNLANKIYIFSGSTNPVRFYKN